MTIFRRAEDGDGVIATACGVCAPGFGMPSSPSRSSCSAEASPSAADPVRAGRSPRLSLAAGQAAAPRPRSGMPHAAICANASSTEVHTAIAIPAARSRAKTSSWPSRRRGPPRRV